MYVRFFSAFAFQLFNLSPDNYPEPGKRPLSSTAPTIIEDVNGDFELAIGGSGGSRIFPSIFQVLTNLDWGLDASTAVEFGRMHDQLYPSYMDIDNVYPQEFVEGLRSRGHNVTGKPGPVLSTVPCLLCSLVQVVDINRIAAVIQLVHKNGDMIYGTSEQLICRISSAYHIFQPPAIPERTV